MAHDFEFGQFVCHELLIFLRRFEEVWHTISDLGNLCANIFSFYFGDRGGVAHDLQFRRFVCHEIFIFPSIISGGRAGLAHKPRKKRFVCQS